MSESIENGFCKTIDGVDKVYYDGYWIKRYEPPVEDLSQKKLLIQSLTRRLFNHMEHGINIPGRLLDQVRSSYDTETDPKKKRVKGAMLAGALFNRAADIFNQCVELEACGVKILADNDLMHACGECLQEALEYGKMVRHRNGDEGIDELWGEPFKAFIMSIEDFYNSRYLKIAITMKNIDEVAAFMTGCIGNDPRYQGLEELIQDYARIARHKCEILRTDEEIFDVWTDFVVAGEEILSFELLHEPAWSELQPSLDEIDARYLIKEGVKLITYIARARTSMPKSTAKYMKVCQHFKARLG